MSSNKQSLSPVDGTVARRDCLAIRRETLLAIMALYEEFDVQSHAGTAKEYCDLLPACQVCGVSPYGFDALFDDDWRIVAILNEDGTLHIGCPHCNDTVEDPKRLQWMARQRYRMAIRRETLLSFMGMQRELENLVKQNPDEPVHDDPIPHTCPDCGGTPTGAGVYCDDDGGIVATFYADQSYIIGCPNCDDDEDD